MKSRLAYTTPPLCTEVRSNYNILKLFIKLTIYKSFLTSITLLTINKAIGFNIKPIAIVKKNIVHIVKRNSKRKWKEFLKMANIL